MEGGSMSGALGALATFGFPALFGIAWLYFRNRARVAQLETIAKIVEAGKELDPELDKILKDGYRRNHKLDYRSGTIWLAIGIPLYVGMLMTSPDEAYVAFIIIGIGIAYFISGYYRWREAE